MRLTLVFPVIQAGGADRVMARLANAWADRGDEVTLLTLDDGRQPPFFPLNPSIRHQPLALDLPSPSPWAMVRRQATRIHALRSAIRASGPQVVVSFMSKVNVLTLLATRGLAAPVVVSQRNNPAGDLSSPAWQHLRRLTWPLADRVVVQTAGIRDQLPRSVRARAAIIPNPVPTPEPDPRTPPSLRLEPPSLLAMGRLIPQKGFDLLIEAFGRVSATYPDWRLAIVGDGEARGALERQRDALGLQDRVTLPGIVRDAPAVMRQAELFVLSSRFEGFPNVLCEAMSYGRAVLAADCPTGPAEIVRDGIDGRLVPAGDARALAAGLEALMADPALRHRLGSRAVEVTERYSLEAILRRWDRVFEEVMGRARC